MAMSAGGIAGWRRLAGLAGVAMALAQVLAEPIPSDTVPLKSSPPPPGVNDVTDSPRERDRVLLKRNPIASEFQVPDTLGRSTGVQADAEINDFRALLPLTGDLLKQPERVELGVFLLLHAGTDRGEPGFEARVRRHSGPPARAWSIEAKVNQSSVDREVEQLAATWEPTSLMFGGKAVYFLQRPKFYQELIRTRTRAASLHVEHQVGPADLLFAQAAWSDYIDDSDIDQIEFNTGVGQPQPGHGDAPQGGTTIVDGAYRSVGRRHYSRLAQTNRQISRFQLGGRHDTKDWTADYAIYHSRWNNRLDAIGWNFYDTGLEVGYRIDDRDPNFPVVTLPAGYDIAGSSARFGDLRDVVVTTRDIDWAGRFDLRRRLTFRGGTLWLGAGGLHRRKERRNGWENNIYFSQPGQPLLYSEFAGDNLPDSIVRDHYSILPPRIDGPTARAHSAAGGPQYAYAVSRSVIERAQDIYFAKEEVSGFYTQARWRRGPWSVEAGLRGERTQTATRGTVIVPVANDTGGGTLLGEVEENGTNYRIREMPATGSYSSWLPAFDVERRLTPDWTFRATLHSRLMRPQYIDIVNYRRTSVTTLKIKEGNPGLRPVSINTFAAALDRHASRFGNFSAELYLTTIRDFFYNAQYFETANGSNYTVSRIENGDRGYLRGFQLQWHQSIALGRLKAAPSLAYTYSESEATVPTRPGARLELPERARHLWQARVDWSRDRVGGAVGFSSQSASLDQIGPAADRDIYRDAVLSLDASLWWRLDEHWRAKLSVINLTDVPERSFEGNRRRVVLNQYTWATWRLGIDARF